MVMNSSSGPAIDSAASSTANTNMTDLDELWIDLENGVQQIYSRQMMSCQRYMYLYSQVYKYCTAQCSPKVHPIRSIKNSKGITDSISTSAEIVGLELYKRMSKFLENHVSQLRNKVDGMRDEDLLKLITSEWNNYRFSSKILNGLCSYLNRHWIRRIIDEGGDDIFELFHLALDVWDRHILSIIHPQLTRAILRLIAADRNGEVVNTRMINDLIYCYIIVEQSALTARHRSTSHSPEPHLFRQMFENEFISETETFYTAEADEFLRNNPISEYMKRVEMRLNEERSRCSLYLGSFTLNRLITVLVNIFVGSRMDQLKAEFKSLLGTDRAEDLKRLYDLCSMVPDTLPDLKKCLETHIYNEGNATMCQAGPSVLLDPKSYVNILLAVHNKYSNLVSVAFRGDRTFVAALDSACSKYMNPAPMQFKVNAKTPEMLARYCDMLLRKGSKNYEEQELESLLSEVMVIFKYLEDKDVFQTFYSKLLAKRLIGQLSASEDAESSMISKLKQSCGYDYTVKLQRMFTDVGLSRSLNEEFKNHLKTLSNSCGVEFSVQVLSTGAWPLSCSTNVTLVPQLTKCMQKFTDYYTNHYSGRKILWLHNYSKVEVVTNCFDRSYCIVMTMFQAVLLQMFNRATSYTLEELQKETTLSPEVLQQVLSQFIKFKLLLAKDADGNLIDIAESGSGQLSPSTVVELAPFKSKKYKLDFSKVPLKLETTKEQESVEKSVSEDRRILVQACVVRIMKMRKCLYHQQLVSEVVSQLGSLFTPRVSLIKKAIDDLIDKDYMRRTEGDRNSYEYLA